MILLLSLSLLLKQTATLPSERWESALARMPLVRRATELNRTNCVPLMVESFQSNRTVKALIFLPGATDEFYFFKRARADLAEGRLTLMDAVSALTNQTLIRVTFRPPLLLLHTDEDPIDPLFQIEDAATAQKLRQRPFMEHGSFNDRDWDFIVPLLDNELKIRCLPKRYSPESWHFYRHSLASWNLSGWEALEAVSLAGKTTFTVQNNRIVFKGDTRTRARPKVQ